MEPIDWRSRLGLERHPERGWFKRIYTALEEVPSAYGPRAAASSIHYLLDREQPQSRFHRVRPTILHFLQSGGPVTYALMNSEGWFQEVTLGFAPGQQIALEVAGGIWKASRLGEDASHALVSEVVIPGFDWADHEYLTYGKVSPAALQELRLRGWQLL